ncbi:MAG: acyl carrier protein [Myxococcota bacterium]
MNQDPTVATPTLDEVYPTLVGIIAEVLVIDRRAVRPDALLFEELDADSITILELNHRCQEELGVRIPDTQIGERILSSTLVDGMLELSTGVGAHSLFASVGWHSDEESGSLFGRGLARAVGSPAFTEALGSALDRVDAGELPPGDLVRVMSWLDEASGLSGPLEELRRAHGALMARVDALPGRADEREVAGSTALGAWERVFPREILTGPLSEVTVGELAEAFGGAVPPRLEPAEPIASLRFRDLFRFVNVRSYAAYVASLQGAG